MNNEVNFTNKKGELNCCWNAGNCGEISGWNTNKYNAKVTSTILPSKIIGRCEGISETESKNNH